MSDIDLTPFGFTPTENLAYRALLELGPTGGYALAKKLSIARANAYQALSGLENKGAASASDERPQRYRALRPDALMVKLIERESGKVDLLESQIFSSPADPTAELVPFHGRRALADLALRTVARESGAIACIAEPDILTAMAPAWRKRLADQRVNKVWMLGSGAAEFSIVEAEPVSVERARERFGSTVFLLHAETVGMCASGGGEDTSGYWTSDPLMIGLINCAIQTLATE